MWLLALRNLNFIMMVNLNECKLGDKLKMRNGELAIYVSIYTRFASHFLV